MGTLDSNNTDTVTTDSDADFDFSEEQLRQAAQALDNGEVADLSFGDGLARPSSGEADEVKSGEQSADSQSTDNAAHNEAQQEDSKPDSEKMEPKESNYSKAKKNAERFDRNWKKLQEQQAELAKQRAELAAREAALQERSQAPVQSTGQPQPNVTQAGFSAERYEQAAEEFEREGEFGMAELARAQAKLLRSNPPAAAPTQSVPQSQQPVQQSAQPVNNGPGSPQFIQTWNENLRALETEADFADLKNRDSALYKATAGVLQEDARFSYFPDGIRVAARIAKLRVEAGAVPALQTKVQAYEQELAKLRAATSPSRGAPNSRGQAKAFEELSLAEQERELMRLAQEVDGA